MSGIAEAIKYFYEDFILRDLVALVTPGTIVVGTAILLQLWDRLEQVQTTLYELPAVFYVPLYGVLFIIGYALQTIGEITNLTPWHDRKDEAEKRLDDKKHLEVLSEVQDISGDPGNRARLVRERFSVKKYMCGNSAVAIIFGSIMLAARLWIKVPFHLVLAALLGVLFIALLLSNRKLVKRQRVWEDVVRLKALKDKQMVS